MKIFEIHARDNHMKQILAEAENTAAELRLPAGEKLKLRLLTEEAVELVNVIIRQYAGELWFETQGRDVTICIQAIKKDMSFQERDLLVGVSSSGKNEAYRGFKGAILSLFDNGYRVTEGMSQNELDSLSSDVIFHSEFSESGGMYIFNHKADKGVSNIGVVEDIEQSILANLADHIEVGVMNQKATIKITKQF